MTKTRHVRITGSGSADDLRARTVIETYLADRLSAPEWWLWSHMPQSWRTAACRRVWEARGRPDRITP